MMKKLNYLFAALMTMLLVTSCSQDETLSIDTNSNEAMVSFNLELPDTGPQTRAISDGKSADVLMYAVFDKDGERIETIQKVSKTGVTFPTTENITLAKGQTYKVAFWAQDEDCKAYTVSDDMQVTVNYANNENKVNNDETRDAFFKTVEFTVTGSTSIDVELKRPFAQINVGVTEADWDAAVASGIEIEKSKVTIEKAATSINLLTGKVAGEQTVEYGFDIIPAKFATPETLDVDLDNDGTKEKYVYLSMSYILANDATTGYAKTTLEDLDFTFAPISGNNINFSEGLKAVPVQRNWRTNIIGQILTGDVKFNITIDPIYDGEYNNGKAQPVNINGVYYATIQDAVNNVKDGDVIKVATGTYNEVVKVGGGKNFTLEAAGPNVVIAALDHQSNENSTVKVKGITFDNSLTPAGWFIGTAPNIAPCVGAWGGNLTFEDCAFIVDGTSGKETGVMTWYTVEKSVASLSFNNCTFEGKGGHASARAMQIYGHVNMQVNNCTFNTKKDYTLKYVAENGNEATFSNNTVNNSKNFVQLGSDVYPGSNYTVNINNNTLGKGVNTHIIANPENQTVNVDGNVSVIAEGVVKDANGNYIASSNEGITNAISDGATTINLTAGNYILPSVNNNDITITGTEDVIITISKPNYSGANLTLSGVTVKGSGFATGVQHVNTVTYKDVKIVGDMCLYGEEVKFENCSFELNNQYIWTYGAKKVSFDKCRFNTTGKAILIYNEGAKANSNVTVTDCTFNATEGAKAGAIANQNCAAIEIDSTHGDSFTLTTSSNSINKEYFSGTWRIKAYNAKVTVNDTEYSTIAIDGQTMTIDTDNNVTVNN